MEMSMTSMMGATTTTSAAAATSAAAMDMGGMGGMGMGGDSCKISMLWNWNTIDACFIAQSWHVRSNGAFAGSCIGIVLLVMVLEALRRAAKEYDAYIVRRRNVTTSSVAVSNDAQSSDVDSQKQPVAQATAVTTGQRQVRPSVTEQLVRALLHTLQFAVAYFVMLLAMYYNGYIIICIFIGAYIGAFVFNWTTIGLGNEGGEPTYCCG